MESDHPIAAAISTIAATASPPSSEEITDQIGSAVETLATEDTHIRPRDGGARPGGLVHLRPGVPLLVLPDIHGRVGFLTSVLNSAFVAHGIDVPLIDALDAGRAQVVMVGDYVHGESRARHRWVRALEEFAGGYRRHSAMDEEMRENLTVLRIVALLKNAYPQLVHALKGNHENIRNEEGEGNHQFGKFVYEGAMVADYMNRFFTNAAVDAVYDFEKSLPLFCVGTQTLISHAEPARFFDRDEIVEYRNRADVVEGFTWTDNDAAETDSVKRMIEHYLPEVALEEAIYIGGHRPVPGRYRLRAEGRYVQIHNPDRYIVAIPPEARRFDPKRDIVELVTPEETGNADG